MATDGIKTACGALIPETAALTRDTDEWYPHTNCCNCAYRLWPQHGPPGCLRPGDTLVVPSLDRIARSLAEFVRELIVEGTKEGLEPARAAGKRLGRPPAMPSEQVRHARDPLSRPDNSVSSIARLLGVSRSTLYKHVPELSEGRAAIQAT